MSLELLEKNVGIRQKDKGMPGRQKSKHRHEKLHTVYKERKKKSFWRINLRQELVRSKTGELGEGSGFSCVMETVFDEKLLMHFRW